METNNKSDLHAAECLIFVIPSNPHPDIDWHVVIEIKHQSFTLAYKAEDRAGAEWMAEMLRAALEKCGTRMAQTNVQRLAHRRGEVISRAANGQHLAVNPEHLES